MKRKTSKTQQDVSNFNLQDIIDNLPGHIYWEDYHGRILGCNRLQAEAAGFKKSQEMVGKTDFDMPWKADAEKIMAMNLEVMNSQKEMVKEETIQKPDGSTVYFISKKIPHYDNDGNVIGLLGISFDITDQKNLELEKQKTVKLEEQLKTAIVVAASVAHELRTPLLSIKNYTEGIQQYMPGLINAYEQAKAAGLPVAEFRTDELDLLKDSLKDIRDETNYTNIFINMLLTNLQQKELNEQSFQYFSIQKIVRATLQRYPLTQVERDMIALSEDIDFCFKGDEELTIHIFFNLLRNALHYTKAAGGGTISIEIKPGEEFNYLYFTDTGLGIEPKELDKVFEPFYSKTRHGSGIGLTFCKMVMQSYNGDITCESEKGKFTRFTLKFPKINIESS